MNLIYNNHDANYQQCVVSLMDNIFDPNISFDQDGISNYYYWFQEQKSKMMYGLKAQEKYNELIAAIKFNGKSRKYDCIIGVSGGVDSSYLSLLAKKENLRVLLVHFDNGWNSELAVHNINRIVERTGFDLYTYVIDWEEFRDIQLSYFKAGVIDIEAVTDIAIFDALDWICKEKNIRYIIDGRNFETESILPSFWTNKNPNNLYDIHRKFGNRELVNYPVKFNNGLYVRPQRFFKNIPLLNYIEYNKAKVKHELQEYFQWRDYGGKHYESVFTRFYQGFILPNKFNVDKRKAHLSNLIFSGQITKEEAVIEINKPIYNESQLAVDMPYVLKKLGMTMEEFEIYMKKPIVFHDEFNNSNVVYKYSIYQRAIQKLVSKIKNKL